MSKNTLYIVRGTAGSGKSTYVKNVLGPKLTAEGRDWFHYESDMAFMKTNLETGEKEYKFNPKMLGFAHARCMAKIREALAAGKDAVVSNTFTTKKEIEPYAEMAKELGADVKVIRMGTWYGSIHNVPDATIDAMKDRISKNPYDGEEIYYGESDNNS